ncbi:MAG: MlaD family protein [Acidimicrobiia bacterium]
MPNPFDTDPRSPALGRLSVLGLLLVVIAFALATTMVLKSQGKLDRLIRVSASLVNVGDGLPVNSDVKFRGILVGYVSAVTTATLGQPNIVHINLRREFASGIPGNVTARVVPSNAFAVSSMQLVDHGEAAPLRPGATIPEDTTLPTVLFQTTISKIRQLLAAVGRSPEQDDVGALTALGEAVQGRGGALREAAGNLNEMVAQLNSIVTPDFGPSTIGALADATAGLKSVAPTLYDALDQAIGPARTLAEKRAQLTDLVSAGINTTATVRDAMNNHTDRMINITTQMSPVIGVVADHSGEFKPIATRFQRLASKIYSVWDPRTNSIPQFQIVSMTPTRQYVRADCPRYGDLLGPSCFTAPEVPTAPKLLPALESMRLGTPKLTENRPNLAPPRDSVGTYGRFGDSPPAVPPPPGVASATPGEPMPPALPAEAPAEPQSPPVVPQAADIASIGPTGSEFEKQQLSLITGGQADAATVLMLGPLVRGTTVNIAPDAPATEGER